MDGQEVYISGWGIGRVLYSLYDGTYVVENAENGEQEIFSRRELAIVTPFGE